MYFTRSLILALASALAAVAQEPTGPNAFTYAEGDMFQATAGEPVTITWDPTTEGTVSLILRSGASSNLAEGTPIAENIPNSGSYTWTPDSDITRGSDYALQIIDDADPSQTNYSPFFVIESDNTVASSTGLVTTGAPSSSLDLPTAVPTASPSMFPTSMTTESDSTATQSSESMTTSGTSSTSTRASTTSQADLQATSESSEGAAARATAMAGMLGAVAFGALAL